VQDGKIIMQARLILYNNAENKIIVFKVKSNKPDKYIVAPSCGVLKGNNVEIIFSVK